MNRKEVNKQLQDPYLGVSTDQETMHSGIVPSRNASDTRVKSNLHMCSRKLLDPPTLQRQAGRLDLVHQITPRDECLLTDSGISWLPIAACMVSTATSDFL